ncbi:CSC1-like protein 1 [Araneus ventricosus]|uniref:CSC1-like protein 1 n=1 Tax=Araneus ventricosus TaxID=182803 RepID=A0A4Y2IP71_ARAVE|nr:CSC1-like protein 1 [Araneus ventricosus]
MSEVQKRSSVYDRCPFIQRPNITFIEGGSFAGIPEHFIMSLTCCVLILIIFLILKRIAWMQQKTAECEILEVGWIGLLYKDVYDFITKSHLRIFGSIYVPIDVNLSFLEMLFYSFFDLKDDEILKRCGVDAMQYLAFHRNIMYYMIVNALVCVFVLLPTNTTGDMAAAGRHFERTTINNLRISSVKIWVPVISGYVLLIVIVITVRVIMLNLKIFYKCAWRERSIIIKNIPKTKISSKSIENYFKIAFPTVQIEDIKLACNYQHLISTNMKLRYAEDNLDICRFVMSRQSREVMVLKSGSFLTRMLTCREDKKIPGREYYENKVNHYKTAIAEELNRLPKKVLPIAFVTFKHRRDAQLVNEAHTPSFSDKMGGKWIFNKAPEPTNVIWENMQLGQTLWSVRAVFINLIVFIVAIFLTTPTIVITSFSLDKVKMEIESRNVVFARFFFTVIIWMLSLVIPALITYSSEFLEYKTKSAIYMSEMKKTVVFLIFTVVILPSLGLTSLSSFFRWSLMNEDQQFDWSCIFFPDNGAFFVEYVLTSTFIGTTMQLIRLPDVLLCSWQLLTARSEVERLSIRRGVIWDFSFGIEYSHSLLIFFVVTFFSLECPIISLPGMAYFFIKYQVNRYNIYFAYSPSRISRKVHILAVKFVMLMVSFKFMGFFFLIHMRGSEWTKATYASNALMWISIIIFVIAFNPCNWKHFCMIDKISRPRKRREYRIVHRDTEQRDVYQPMALRKYLPYISSLDKYNNPIQPRQSFRSLAEALVRDIESLEDSNIEKSNEGD